MTTHKEFMASLPKKRRAVIRARAVELLAEEMPLQELRKARDHSQETTAEALGLKQAAVSRLEHRDDMRISTLREYVQALGGELECYARFTEHGAKARLVRIRQKNHDTHQRV